MAGRAGRAKRLEGRSSSLTRGFADSEETAFCIVGNLLRIGLAPSTDLRAPTLFRNSILVNAILNVMFSSESANSFGEKDRCESRLFFFLRVQLVLLSRATSVAVITQLPLNNEYAAKALGFAALRIDDQSIFLWPQPSNEFSG